MKQTAPIPTATGSPGALLREEDIPVIREFLPEARGYLESAEAELLKLDPAIHNADAIDSVFRSFHTIKGVAGFVNLTQIGALAHATETLLADVRSSETPLLREGIDLVLQSLDVMNALVNVLESALEKSAPLLDDARVAPLLARLESWSNTTPTIAAAPVEAVQSPESPASAKTTMRVSTERLDNLINTVGELVIAQAMVIEDVAPLAASTPRLGRNIARLSKIARNLQDLSMSMRMVPVRGAFQKMTRLVRDLAAQSGKQVELFTEGEDTEIDRNLVEAIEDPLMHMIRNAIDHGIELPAAREGGGKPATGSIQLRARHEAGNVVIEITDDGRGLDKQRIREKAEAVGLITPGQELSENDIFRLIFCAGLSTAETITSVSGRGVGMDVVARNVEQVRGRIDIQSIAGKGTTFTLRMPLTLALIDGLLVRVGQSIYIIPLSSVEQSVQLKASELSTVQGRTEMCMLRNSLLPLCRLHRLFGIDQAIEDPLAGVVVIVHDGQRRCCLLVDQLLNQQQVVIKPLSDGVGHVRGISGGAILGNGNVSLILDIPTLLDSAVLCASVPQKEVLRECVNQ